MATVKKDNKLMALLSVWGILLVLLGHSGFEEPEIQQKLGWQHWNLVVLGMFLGDVLYEQLYICSFSPNKTLVFYVVYIYQLFHVVLYHSAHMEHNNNLYHVLYVQPFFHLYI